MDASKIIRLLAVIVAIIVIAVVAGQGSGGGTQISAPMPEGFSGL